MLVVEDEALLALDLDFALHDEGAEVIGPALTLEQALDLAGRPAPIDAALLDVDLSGRDVFPVAAELQRRGVPIVFHTGHAGQAELATVFPGSITCAKPAAVDLLVASLARQARKPGQLPV